MGRKKTETLSHRLRVKREEKGWSQALLAAKAGTSESVIRDIEAGDMQKPENVVAIARALDVSPWWLMLGID